MPIVTAMLLGFSAYWFVGVLAGFAFIVWGVGIVDQSARGAGAPWGFRVLIWPGAAALWPLMLTKWVRAARAAGSSGS